MMIKIKKQKAVAVILIFAMCFLLAGCGTEKKDDDKKKKYDESSLTDADGFVTVKDYVTTLQDDVKVRRSPEEKGDVYITLDKGVDLTRTGVKDEWTRILLNGSDYYIESRFVEETLINWATETDVEKETHIVYIDPAKQITEDMTLEPVSPETDNPEGESEVVATATSAPRAGMKAKMSASAAGTVTGNFEYDITMTVANYLNAELVKRGYTVYLSRTTNNVNISNAKRAQMANACDAEVYIKLETPAARDPSASGILGFIATSTNPHSGTMYQKNYELCYDLLRETCEETGGKRMGIYETDDLTALNYCDCPATVLNMGFLSNELDDQALGTEEYQKKLAVGIADGIDLYFESVE
ncbi:MAG: N-acetylmuramoyl-L-alanine amidase [Eubacterium sp.]|nr:N-acetylmuramoyl-L-alanine amidase [Eubacterium sp.]